METLRRSDQRRISAFVRKLYCLHSVKAISEQVVQRIDNLIGGNCAWVLCESKTEAPHLLAENVGARVAETAARSFGAPARASLNQISYRERLI